MTTPARLSYGIIGVGVGVGVAQGSVGFGNPAAARPSLMEVIVAGRTMLVFDRANPTTLDFDVHHFLWLPLFWPISYAFLQRRIFV